MIGDKRMGRQAVNGCVLLIGLILVSNASAANFRVENKSSGGAEVHFRYGVEFYCEDLPERGTSAHIEAEKSYTFICALESRACFRYMKDYMADWSDWYSSDCDEDNNSGDFN